MRDEPVYSNYFKTHSVVSVALPAFLVALFTFLIFLPVLNNDIVNWDDYTYVWSNPNIRSLDMAFVKWSLTSLVVSNWHPLAMLSHAIDYRLFGLNPWGHHLTSIIIHALNTFLLFILVHTLYLRARVGVNADASRALYALITALTASLLFGTHPIHVESVAWMSERKDVLFGFFYLFSVILYLGSTKRESSWKAYYAAAFFSFLLALLSKPMAVSLPVVLLIIDYFPLQRLDAPGRVKILIEKAPFVFMSFLFSTVTFLSYSSTGSVVKLADTSLFERILVSARAYSFYLYKLIWPVDFAPLYPFPEGIRLSSPEFLISVLVFISLTIFVIFMARRLRVISSLWAYYIITLLPIVGIVRVGQQGAADRYTYLPVIAPFILIGLLFAYFVRRFRSRTALAIIAISLILISAVLSSLTIKQSRVWKDSLSLWSHEIELYPVGSFTAYINRGSAYEERGEYELALADYTTAIELKPEDANIFVGRGNVHYKRGDIARAVEEYNKALMIRPKHTSALISLGVIAQDRGDMDAALALFDMAIENDSKSSEALLHRGIALVNTGRAKAGIRDIQAAIDLGEKRAELYNARALAFYSLHFYEDAEEDYRLAIEIDPAYAEAYYNLGLLYSTQNKVEQARESYEKALELGLKEAGEALQSLE